MRFNQNERLSRKQTIRDSLQMSQDFYLNNLEKSEEYLPVELRTPPRKVSTQSDDRRMLLNKEIADHFLVDSNDEERLSQLEDKAKKKKKTPKHRSKSSAIPNDEDDDDDQSISLDEVYEVSSAQTHCTLHCSMPEDSFYMSDITDEDEPLDQTWESERRIKRKKAKKERRRSKSGGSLAEFDRSRKSAKDKRRPRSEGNLGDSGGVKKSSRRKKKSRSLDPATRSRSSNNSISRSSRSEAKSQQSASKLRRPRNSMEKNEKHRRSKSAEKGKRKGRKTTRRKTLSHSDYVISDESRFSESFELVSESIDRLDSMRELRRPRNSLENSPKSKKVRRKPRSEKNRKAAVDGLSKSWHISSIS